MTMVERVSRALRKSVDRHEVRLLDEQWNELARVAISAMREPTEAMLACEQRFLSEELGYAEIWRRMIDAALAPEPTR